MAIELIKKISSVLVIEDGILKYRLGGTYDFDIDIEKKVVTLKRDQDYDIAFKLEDVVKIDGEDVSLDFEGFCAQIDAVFYKATASGGGGSVASYSQASIDNLVARVNTALATAGTAEAYDQASVDELVKNVKDTLAMASNGTAYEKSSVDALVAKLNNLIDKANTVTIPTPTSVTLPKMATMPPLTKITNQLY